MIQCENCGETLNDVLFIADNPEEITDAEVICDHCGEESGTSVARAHEVMTA